jgi:hypothetical protein
MIVANAPSVFLLVVKNEAIFLSQNRRVNL